MEGGECEWQLHVCSYSYIHLYHHRKEQCNVHTSKVHSLMAGWSVLYLEYGQTNVQDKKCSL